MEDPFPWEHELFGSSPSEESTGDVGEEVSNNNLIDSSSLEAGDSISCPELSSGSRTPRGLVVGSNTTELEILEHGPRTGMLFPDLESLFTAYQSHAKHKGFSVTKRTSRKAGQDEYKYTVFVCDRARVSTIKKYSKKIGCQARVNATRMDDGSWVVGKICSEHNHELCPNISVLMPAHRTLTLNLKRQLEANDIAGIRVCKNVRLAEVQSGGPQNLGCLPKDCRNYVDYRRRLRLGVGDADAIRKLFVRLQRQEREFFHVMDIGDSGRLRNMLWVHPRSKATYEEFHDVVTFDTTYLVNRYRMPFATVVGVNHHGQSILLGCALVTHEDAESFKWVFSNWLEAMGGIAPIAIITDQCESIRIAIRELMPNFVHRYCLWHILSKVPNKFKGITNYHSASKEFKELVFESLSITDFERRWADLVVKHGLESNDWLRVLYEERESWVPVYLNHLFWAGMTSTQRSEGMHAFFDGYINPRCTLKQFVEQYEIAMADKIQKEFIADYDSKTKVLRCVTLFPWEKQFRDAYTNSIFKKFQEEINRLLYCHTIVELTDGSIQPALVRTYDVTESHYTNGRYVWDSTYRVNSRHVGDYYDCNCRSFEYRGIVCCHVLKVLGCQNVRTLNDRYFLRRWRKDVYMRYSSIFFAGGYPHMTEEYRQFQEVERYFQHCTDAAIGSVSKMELLKQRCIVLVDEIKNYEHTPSRTNTNASGPTHPVDSVGGTPILSPDVACPVGRPRGSRIPSGFERGRHGRGSHGRRGRAGLRGGRSNSAQGSHNINLHDNFTGTQESVAFYGNPLFRC